MHVQMLMSYIVDMHVPCGGIITQLYYQSSSWIDAIHIHRHHVIVEFHKGKLLFLIINNNYLKCNYQYTIATEK